MGYVILARNPTNGRVVAITTNAESDDPPIAVYATEEEAELAAHKVRVCKAWPYAVVEAP